MVLSSAISCIIACGLKYLWGMQVFFLLMSKLKYNFLFLFFTPPPPPHLFDNAFLIKNFLVV